MVDAKTAKVLHGNTGYLQLDGEMVGRVKNITVDMDGVPNEFYEVGSDWVQDVVVSQRKVNITVERGIIDYKLLSYVLGAFTDIDEGVLLDATTGNYQLVFDNSTNNFSITDGNGVSFITVPFLFEVVLIAEAAQQSTGGLVKGDRRITITDCTMIKATINAPNSDYWDASFQMIGRGMYGSDAIPLTTS